MSEPAEVAVEILAVLRSVCLSLPEAYGEAAWVGTRWSVHRRAFAHVLKVEQGWPPAYARAAASHGPTTVMTFRSAGAELEALRGAGHPFFPPRWNANVVGLVLDAGVDWGEVGELVTESYSVVAPKRLARLVEGVPEEEGDPPAAAS